MQQAMIEGLVQSVHPEKLFFYLPGFDEQRTAALYDLDLIDYQEIKARFAALARDAAGELLAEPGFAARADRLPFRPEATLVGIGDSLTADLQSWLEILRHLLDLRRGPDRIRVVNAAVSARTSADLLHYVIPVIGEQPDWVFCLAGGGDAKRVGTNAAKTLVSLEETAANLAELRRIAAEQTQAKWVWLTPGVADEAAVDAYPPFQRGQSRWHNADLLAVGDVIRRQPEPVVDLQAVFGNPPDSALLSPDGLHPSLAGQQAIRAPSSSA